MAARRIIYFALLITVGILHFAYGQYMTHFMLIFLLCIPVLSLLLSLPAALSANTLLLGGEDICRGRESQVRLRAKCRGPLPPEAWSITLEAQNLFTGGSTTHQKIKIGSHKKLEKVFSTDTSKLGAIRYRIKRAVIFDYLGLFPIPVKKGGSVTVTVLPDKEIPVPEPALIENSAMALRPKPQGFSEEHELRPYRDGDPINLIHWKLSLKMDDYIIREPQEIVRREILLVIDKPADYEQHRSILEQLCFLNGVLAEQQVPYLLQYGRDTVLIDSINAYDDFIRGILSEPAHPAKATLPDIANDALIYRITPGKEARNEA